MARPMRDSNRGVSCGRQLRAAGIRKEMVEAGPELTSNDASSSDQRLPILTKQSLDLYYGLSSTSTGWGRGRGSGKFVDEPGSSRWGERNEANCRFCFSGKGDSG